jgi:cysteine desulfurase family protein
MIYLDNSATSYPKAPGVSDAIIEAINQAGTSGRASYNEALKGSRILYSCRENIARLFSVKNSNRIILNSGTTESLNTVIQGFLEKDMSVLTSSFEHNSVMRVLQHLRQEKNISFRRFRSFDDGTVDLQNYSECLKTSPDLVVLCHSSNVTGAILPIKEMISLAHESGALVCIDGAQSAGHEDINLEDLEADFFCFSGHKGLLGPTGTGGFYIRDGIKIKPLMRGGTGSRSDEEVQPDTLPDLFESGTRNITGYAGLSASVSYIRDEGVSTIREKESLLTRQLIDGLKNIDGITLLGPPSNRQRNSVVSIIHDRINISDLAEFLDEADIAQRMGLHCSPSAHKVLKTYDKGGTIRFSPGYFNKAEDIEKTIEIIRKITYEG